jgi:integrase
MGSIIYQIQKELESQMRIGDSRYDAKIVEKTNFPQGIFSYGTFATYLKQGCHFGKWVKEIHNCNTLVKARPFVEEYLRLGIEKGHSAYTLSTRRAALCKIYHCTASDIDIQLPERKRSDIKRSRGDAVRDKDFSVVNNAQIISFCRGTGLRAHELAKLTAENVVTRRGKLYLENVRGKGGKIRSVEVLKPYYSAVLDAVEGKHTEELLFKVPSHMDTHGYRREYAQALYNSIARPINTITVRKELYFCRGDRRGITYDKVAMKYVSNQLGHNRVSVIAGHYLN